MMAKLTLSDAAQARREDILRHVLHEAGRLHRRRRQRLAIAGSVCGLLILLLPWWWSPGIDGPTTHVKKPLSPDPAAPSKQVAISPGEPEVPVAQRARPRIEIVTTRPGCAEKYLVRSEGLPDFVTLLDDEGLIAELAKLDLQVGIARTSDRLWLTGDMELVAKIR